MDSILVHVLGHAPVLAGTFTSREVQDGSGIARLHAFGDDLLPPSAMRREPFHAAMAADIRTQSP